MNFINGGERRRFDRNIGLRIDDNLSPWWDFTILPDIVSLRSNDLTFIEMKFYF